MSVPFNPENLSEMRSILTSAKREFSRRVLEDDTIATAVMNKVAQGGMSAEDNFPDFWVEPYAINYENGDQEQCLAIAHSRTTTETEGNVERSEERTVFDYLRFVKCSAEDGKSYILQTFMDAYGDETPSHAEVDAVVEHFQECGGRLQDQMPGMIDIDPRNNLFDLVPEIQARADARAKLN